MDLLSVFMWVVSVVQPITEDSVWETTDEAWLAPSVPANPCQGLGVPKGDMPAPQPLAEGDTEDSACRQAYKLAARLRYFQYLENMDQMCFIGNAPDSQQCYLPDCAYLQWVEFMNDRATIYRTYLACVRNRP